MTRDDIIDAIGVAIHRDGLLAPPPREISEGVLLAIEALGVRLVPVDSCGTAIEAAEEPVKTSLSFL